MRENLTSKTILIVAVLVVCVLGITGIPSGFSGAALKTSILNRIHLGLDLKGGTHLILQVMVDEAVGITTDSDASHIQQDLQSNGITVGSVTKPDTANPALIQINGAPPDRVSDIRSVLTARYGQDYDIASGANNATWTLTMKPTAVADLKKRALDQSIEVIRTRVDTLGVSEPVIQEYNLGSDQILLGAARRRLRRPRQVRHPVHRPARASSGARRPLHQRAGRAFAAWRQRSLRRKARPDRSRRIALRLV